MRAKKTNDYPHCEVLGQYERLISEFPTIERKGKTMPYTSVNGHMFSFLDKEGRMSLRLPESPRIELMEKFDTQLSVQHGRVMKEYVLVPEKLLEDLSALKRYFKAGYDYTCSLKPK